MAADANAEILVPTKRVVGTRTNRKQGLGGRKSSSNLVRDAALVTTAAMATATGVVGIHQASKGKFRDQDGYPAAVVRQVDPQVQSSEVEIVDVRAQDKYFDLVYPGMTDSEKQELLVQVDSLRETIRSSYMADGGWQRVAQNREVIARYAKEAGIPEDFLIGMVIVESSCKRFNVSKSGAKGLTQVMDAIALKYHLLIASDETDGRFDVDNELRVTSSELADYKQHWGDNLALVFEEWHMGAPQLYDILRSYISRHYRIDLGDINNKDLSNEQAQEIGQNYLNFIKRNDINLYNIFKDEEIAASLSGENFDSTLKYVPLILAAAIEWRENKDRILASSATSEEFLQAAA